MRDAFLDLALGGRCLGCDEPGRAVCARCLRALPGDPGCVFPACPEPRPAGLVPVLAAAEYDGLVRRMIVRHKEDQAFALSRPLGSLLAMPLTLALARWPAGTLPVLVPVPSRAHAVRTRGHDPLDRIVRAALRRIGPPSPAPYVAHLLRHRGRTADQGELGAAARAENLAGAFAIRTGGLGRLARHARAGSATVIICDDVCTTGSTVREAQRALEEVGIGVGLVAVVAATRLRRRR